jgi:hypothetical protein
MKMMRDIPDSFKQAGAAGAVLASQEWSEF